MGEMHIKSVSEDLESRMEKGFHANRAAGACDSVGGGRISFAENLKEAMDWAGVSCGQLAEAVHATVGQVYRWRGGQHVPHAELIGDIADALGCTCDWLISGRA